MSGGRLQRAHPMPRGVPISTPDPEAERLADAYYAQIDAEIDEGERQFNERAFRDEDYRREHEESAIDFALRTEPDPRICSTMEAM